MKLREWVNKNSPIVTLAAVLILCICVYRLAIGGEKPHSPTKAYYYDLETGKLFIGPNSALPPIPTPSGHKDANGSDFGVRAIVFSCGQCADETKRYIGYLETMTPEAKEQVKQMMEDASKTGGTNTPMMPVPPKTDPLMSGRLIVSPDKTEWLSMQSPDSGKLIQEAMSKCGEGKYPNQCFPDMP